MVISPTRPGRRSRRTFYNQLVSQAIFGPGGLDTLVNNAGKPGVGLGTLSSS